MSEHTKEEDPPKRITRLSSSGTWIQGSMVAAALLLSVSGTVAFVKTSSRAESATDGMARLELIVVDNTKATGELTKTIISLQGDVKNLNGSVSHLQTTTTENARDGQQHELEMTKLRSDVDNIRERMHAIESSVKAIEARLLSVEFISRTSAAGGGEK